MEEKSGVVARKIAPYENREIPRNRWLGTMVNPSMFDIIDLWSFTTPDGVVPNPPHKLEYLIMGA